MIVFRVAVVVHEHHMDDASIMFANLAVASRLVPGVIHFDILQDPSQATRFVSIEVYSDQAALDRQSALPEVEQVMAAFDHLLSSGPDGDIYHVTTSEPWPVLAVTRNGHTTESPRSEETPS